MTPYARAAIEREAAAVAAATEGTRNDDLNRAAFRLGQLVAGEECTAQEAAQALADACAANGLAREDGPRACEATIRSGLAAGMASPRAAPERPARPAQAQARAVAPAPPPAAEDDGETAECTDLANAERLVYDHGRDMLYCAGLGGWHAWDGRRWARDETGEVARRAKDTARRLRAEAADDMRAARKDLEALADSDDDVAKGDAASRFKRAAAAYAWARTSQNAQKLAAMASVAETEPGISHVADSLDADPWVLCTQSGTVDLRTGQMRPHERADRITKITGAACGSSADAPLWTAFLSRIFDGNADLIAFMQRFLGYCLVGRPTEEVLAVMWGGGANGKSTLINTLAAVLGDYFRPLDPEVLLVTRNASSKVDSEKAALKGVRFAACSETSQLRTLDEGHLKALASTDRIVGKRLYADPIAFAPSHQLVLVTNHRPTVRTTDLGTWRRILLVPFTVTIPEAERDGLLSAKLGREGPAILRWLVDGCREWQRQGLAPCETVLAATRAYRADQDVIGDFLEASTVSTEAASAKASDLYRAFKIWSESSGGPAMSQTAFGETLAERGFTRVKRRGVKWYLGISLLEKGGDSGDSWTLSQESLHARARAREEFPLKRVQPSQPSPPAGADDPDPWGQA